MKKQILSTSFFVISAIPFSIAQDANDVAGLKQMLIQLNEKLDNINQRMDEIEKHADEVLWYNKVGDIASIEKVQLPGLPLANIKNPNAKGAKNPLLFYSYIFMPKNIDKGKKYPLIVFPHGGIHSNFSTYYSRTVREFVAQGYIVVAPEYRGSSGYGQDMYDAIDYGGLEVEDVYASKNYVVENYSFIDKDRVGIFGWSHGGTITLLNIFKHPDDYKVAYAGEPVSDLIYRMGYMSEGYRKLFSADTHIGTSVNDNMEEYRKRSPIWYADKLQTPLLIHSSTNDEDVSVLEVELLVKALKAEGKKFEYEIYKDYPGGHNFDRIDTKQSKEVQLKVFKFMAKYLEPSKPFKTLKDLEDAGYQ